MKAWKWIAGGVAALLIVAAAAASWLLASFDPNAYKGRITDAVKQAKDRTLRIDGPITLKLWPSLHLRASGVTLSEKGRPDLFVSADTLELSLRLLPLLRRQLVIDKVAASKVTLNYVRGKDGKRNFDDLLGGDSPPGAGPGLAFDVKDFELSGVTVSVRDALAGTNLAVRNLRLASGRLADKVPTRIDASGELHGQQPKMLASFSVNGGLLFDLQAQRYEFTQAAIAIKGSGPYFDKLDAELRGSLRFDGKQLALDAEDFRLKGTGTVMTAAALRPGATTLSDAAFDIHAPKLALSLDTQTLGSDRFDVKLSGKLDGQPLNLAVAADRLEADLSKPLVKARKLHSSGGGSVAGTRVESFSLSAPELQFDGKASQASLRDLRLAAKGASGANRFDASLSAPSLSVTPDAARGAALDGRFKIEGATPLEGTITSGAVSGTMKALRIDDVRLAGRGAQGGRSAALDASADVLANLQALRFELPRLALTLDAQDPAQAFKRLALNAQGQAAWDVPARRGNAALKGRLDDSSFTLAASAALGTPTAVRADVTLDQLNVDRYMPPAPPGQAAKAGGDANATPVDLSFVEDMLVSGSLKAGTVRWQGKTFNDVHVQAKGERGRLLLPVTSARAYGGSIDGSAMIESARGGTQRVALKHTLANINVQQALRDFAGKDLLEGKGNLALDVTATGTTLGQIKKSLSGNAKLLIRDGAVKGINLAKKLREAKAALSLNSDQKVAASQSEKTDFSELSATLAIANGIAANNDLSIKSPFLRIGGEGKVDIGNDRLDYTVRATVVNTAKGQDAGDLGKLKDVTIPVRLSGPFDAIGYDILWSQVASAAAAAAVKNKVDAAKERAKAQLQDQLRSQLGLPGKPAAAPAAAASAPPAPQKSVQDQLREKAQDRLKGLFGR